jgi:hypothetical protein
MKLWKRTVLALGAVALLFTARPAQAQVWIGPPAPVMVTPTWGVAPSWGAVPVWQPAPTWGVAPGWRAAPAWGVRTYYRPVYRPFRRGWYGVARGPRGGTVAFRRW